MGSIVRLGEAGRQGQWHDWLKSYRLEDGASAVVAGHSCLFLGETQQLLPDGLDQGGRGVGGRRRIQGRWG